jgi:uncharacterized protein
MMTDELRIIYDPIYGAIHPTELEWQLIMARSVQRLKGIKQLGLVDTVYPGANHTRFEHSIGTMEIAGRIGSHLNLSFEDIQKVRVAGLLHDLGHSALSHAVEAVLSRNPDIQPIIAGKKIYRHEDFTSHIVLAHCFGDGVNELAEEKFGGADNFFEEISGIILGRKPLGQIISSDLDADRIDFLLRDSHHTGVSLGLIDLDQIVQSLIFLNDRLILKGSEGYRTDMSLTAAESMLIARAHHYTALIYNPYVQSIRAMLLFALESVLEEMDQKEARAETRRFFTEYNDCDLMGFLNQKASPEVKEILDRIRHGRHNHLAARLDHRTLTPEARMALATISRNGRAMKLLERGLGKEYNCLVDISVGSGVPKSIRTEDGFLYDESALAAGLIRSLARQITLSFFSNSKIEISMGVVTKLASKLLNFVRSENYLPIEGLMLLFLGLHRVLSESYGERILVPRIRNITWLYKTVKRLRDHVGLRELFDYNFHEDYGFPYSERLFEDIQVLVAVGMVYQDLRHHEIGSRWKQRYEYMLTAEGLKYAESLSNSYQNEILALEKVLRMEKHTIPYDMTGMLLKRYTGQRSHSEGQ